MDYRNKVILITGASSDIGKEMIFFFLEKGAKVIATYYNNRKVCNMIEKYPNLEIQYLDLKSEKSIKKLFDFTKKTHEKIDILINNAAVSMDSYYLDKTKSEFMEVLEINVVGTFLMIKYFQSIMDCGYIFNISSTDGIDTGNVYSIDYNVSKAGINMLTKTISLDNDNTLISICPNWVDTESTRKMDQSYLESELKRINQKKIINAKVIPKIIDKCMKEKVKSGSIIRIDGDEDVR